MRFLVALVLASSLSPISPGGNSARTPEWVQPGSGSRSPFINVRAAPYFAVGDGVADDTAALQAALTAAKTGHVLLIPAGTYLYTSLSITNMKTAEIVGEGNRATILRYNGAVGGTAFLMRNGYRNTIRGIRFDRVTNDPDIMIEVQEDKNQSDYDSSAPSQLNRFQEITVKNGGIGIAVGLPAGAVAGDDIMNDTHVFDHVLMDGQTVANVKLTGANVLRVGFINCYFIGAPTAVIAASSPAGGCPGFYWHGGYVNSSVVNFDLQSLTTDGHQFRDVRSESSPRFLKVASGAISDPITIDGIYYSAANLNVDTFAISALGGGPYYIRGSTWGTGADVPPRFSINPVDPTNVVIESNAFEAAGSDTVTLVSGANARAIYIGNRFKTAGLVRSTKVENPGTFTGTRTSVTYATGSTTSLGIPDWKVTNWFKVAATNNLQFGWDNPVNAVDGQCARYQIKNGSGGALNVASPFQAGKYRLVAYAAPANTTGRIWTFCYDSAADTYYEVRSDADVGN